MLRTFAARRLSPLSSPAESAGQVDALQTARQRERVDFFKKVSVGFGGNFTGIADQVREKKKKKRSVGSGAHANEPFPKPL